MDVKVGRSPPSTGQVCAIADQQRLALDHMLAALRHLDNDVGVSPFVGVQLQLAIDRLAASTSADYKQISATFGNSIPPRHIYLCCRQRCGARPMSWRSPP